jgi:hypothetical protein
LRGILDQQVGVGVAKLPFDHSEWMLNLRPRAPPPADMRNAQALLPNHLGDLQP